MVRVEAGRKSVESNFRDKLVECNEALQPFFKTDQFDVKAKERNDLTGQKKVNDVMLFLYILQSISITYTAPQSVYI